MPRVVLAVLALSLAFAAGAVAQESGGGADGDGLPAGLTPPTVLADAPAPFPPEALAADVQADVVVQIDIGADGSVSNIVPLTVVYFTYDAEGYLVEESIAPEADTWGFVAPAVEAIAQYVFTPAILVDEANPEGAPVAVQVQWRIGFVIEYEEQVREATEEDFGSESDGSGSDEEIAAGSGSGAEGGGPQVGEGPVNFRGRLLERGTREPLGAFRVRIARIGDEAPDSAEALSDPEGRFEFRGVPEGDWRVTIDESEYFLFQVTETISRTEVTDATYYVERSSYGEYVSTTRVEAPRREVTRQTLQVTEISRIPGNNNDAVKVVQSLPGVARASFGGGEVIVRGSAPEDSAFLLDGMRIPLVYHFGGLRAVVPTELLEQLDFYPGAFSSQYGRATGGVIALVSNDDQPGSSSAYIDVNVFDTSAFADLRLADNLSLQLGGRRSYIDAVLIPLADVLQLQFTTAPRYWDYQAKLRWRINEDHSASLLWFGADDLLDFVIEEVEEEAAPAEQGGIRFYTSFHYLLLKLNSQLLENVRNDFRMLAGVTDFGGGFGEQFFLDLDLGQLQWRDTITWEATERTLIRTGVDIQLTDFDIAVRLPRPPKEGEEMVDMDALEIIETREDGVFYSPATFVEADVEVVEGVRVIPGGRAEYYNQVEAWAFDPRLGVRWQLSEPLLLKAGVGTFHQPPDAEETSVGFGNPGLGLESAIHYVVGTEYTFSEALNANVEFFYKDLGDLVTRSNDVVERDGQLVPEVYSNDATGRSYGAEVLIRHELARNFFGWIAYTLSRSERIDAPGEDYRLFDYDQTHILTALGSYNLPRNWSVGLKWRYVTGNPTTPIIGAVYDADSNVYVRVPGESNSDRARPFHQLDLRVDKRWVFDVWTLNLYLDLQNAYNNRNQEDVQYSYDYSESADVVGLPIIPSFGLRAEY